MPSPTAAPHPSRGGAPSSSGGRPRRWRRAGAAVRHPVVLVLLLAPCAGEVLSGSTPPLDLLLPWNLVVLVALYGCGALVAHEVTVRLGLGRSGLVLLGCAYGVWEEGVVDRFWFSPDFWAQTGVGGYSVVGHTNVLLAAHLTLFHALVSITGPVLVVERLTPARRGRPWTTRTGLAVAAIVLALTPLVYGVLERRPPWPDVAAAAGVLVAFVVAAVLVRRRQTPAGGLGPFGTPRAPRPSRPWLAVIACATVLVHWVATYGVPATGLPWPVGVLVALLPVAVGTLVLRRMGAGDPDGGVRVIAGVALFFGLLDAGVGLGGRYDLSVAGVAVAAVAVAVARRYRPRRQPQPSS